MYFWEVFWNVGSSEATLAQAYVRLEPFSFLAEIIVAEIDIEVGVLG